MYEIRPKNGFGRTGETATDARVNSLRRALETRDDPTASDADKEQARSTVGVLSPHFDVTETAETATEPQGAYRGASYSDAGGSASTDAETRAFNSYLRNGVTSMELRAAGEATGGAGGFLVPQSFFDRLAIALKMYGGLSQFATQQETPDGRIMPFPTNDPTAILGSYISENTQISDQDYVFGSGKLFAWTITSGVIKAGLALVQDSAVDVDAFVAARVGESIGRKVAAEVVSGDGPSSQAITGIIPALQDFGEVSDSGGYYQLGNATVAKMFGNDSATEAGDNVIGLATAAQMVQSLDPAYWPGAAWYVNADQATNIRSLVDDENRSLMNLNDSMSGGNPGSLFGFPVRVCNEIPDIATSTVGGPMLANMEHAYVLRMVRESGIMRLTERYADFLQVGYIGWQRVDGQPVDLRAAVTVKGGSS